MPFFLANKAIPHSRVRRAAAMAAAAWPRALASRTSHLPLSRRGFLLAVRPGGSVFDWTARAWEHPFLPGEEHQISARLYHSPDTSRDSSALGWQKSWMGNWGPCGSLSGLSTETSPLFLKGFQQDIPIPLPRLPVCAEHPSGHECAHTHTHTHTRAWVCGRYVCLPCAHVLGLRWLYLQPCVH